MSHASCPLSDPRFRLSPELITFNLGMRHDLKRSPSPLPLSDVKKLKQEYDWDQDEIPFSTAKRGRSPTYDPERMTFEDDPNHGTVFKSVPHLAQNSVLNAIIVQTTCELSAVGKRLVQAPQLL